MKWLICTALIVLATLIPDINKAQTKTKVVDYLNASAPLVFNNETYHLVWSSHPNSNYYKQEYLTKGDNLERFKTMLLLEVVTGNKDLKGVVGAKVAELKKMKETNPMVNYEMIQNPNTGEYLLDFLLTSNTASGDISIVEWNAYRYRLFTDKNGQSGIQLFAFSKRGYAPAVDPFLANLKTIRKDLVNKLAMYKLSEVKILP